MLTHLSVIIVGNSGNLAGLNFKDKRFTKALAYIFSGKNLQRFQLYEMLKNQNYTMCKYVYSPVMIGQQTIQQNDSPKYERTFVHSLLNWYIISV